MFFLRSEFTRSKKDTNLITNSFIKEKHQVKDAFIRVIVRDSRKIVIYPDLAKETKIIKLFLAVLS